MVVCAGLLETGFAVCLKKSDGFSRLLPTIGFALFALGSFALLTLALKKLEVGPAYAVWTGIGAAGTVSYGMLFLNESVSTLKIISVVLIVLGVDTASTSPARTTDALRGRHAGLSLPGQVRACYICSMRTEDATKVSCPRCKRSDRIVQAADVRQGCRRVGRVGRVGRRSGDGGVDPALPGP